MDDASTKRNRANEALSATEGRNPGSALGLVSRKAARTALIVLHAAALAAVLVEVLHPFPSDDHAVERVGALDFVGSYAVYGFVACVVLVLLGKLLRRAVMRDERYYDGDR
jgi:hypothetical protein